MNDVVEAFDLIFNNPSSIFVTMTAKEFIDDGIQIDCNQTTLVAKVYNSIFNQPFIYSITILKGSVFCNAKEWKIENS